MFRYNFIVFPESFQIDPDRVDQIFDAVDHEIARAQHGTLNIAFLSDDMIRDLNQTYRGIDRSTDVLSFHYYDDFTDLSPEEIAGECIFSEAKIIAQAREHGHTAEAEFEILLIHSLLHILGFDHESEVDYHAMWQHEKKLRQQFALE